jgi:hypothetical protein
MNHDPVQVICLPASSRCELYNEDEGPSLAHYDLPDEPRMPSAFDDPFADLPIEMPSKVMIWTDDKGNPVSAWATWDPEPAAQGDSTMPTVTEAKTLRICWKDLDIFYQGIIEYNRACRPPSRRLRVTPPCRP